VVSGGNARTGTYTTRIGDGSLYTNATLSRTFSVPTSGVTDLVFSYKDVCNDSITYDWFTVTLWDNNTQTSYTVVPAECSDTGEWNLVTYPIAALAGHSVTLTFQSKDDAYSGDESWAFVDDIFVH
jgi:hypothetical protein